MVIDLEALDKELDSGRGLDLAAIDRELAGPKPAQPTKTAVQDFGPIAKTAADYPDLVPDTSQDYSFWGTSETPKAVQQAPTIVGEGIQPEAATTVQPAGPSRPFASPFGGPSAVPRVDESERMLNAIAEATGLIEIPRTIKAAPEIVKAAKQMPAPTAGDIYKKLSWLKTYVASLGGRIGPKGLRDDLLKDAEGFSGFGPAIAPAAGDIGQTALEWGLVYPKLFRAMGLAGNAIAKIPQVRVAQEAIARSGGVQKLVKQYPRLVAASEKALADIAKGAGAGGTIAGAEVIGKDMPALQVAEHIAKGAAVTGGVAGIFSMAGSIDTKLYADKLRRELTGITQRRYDARINALPKGMADKNAGAIIRQEKLELQQIDDIVAGVEAELMALKSGRMYSTGQEGIETPSQAATRIARYGYEGKRVAPKGPAGLKTGMGKRPKGDVIDMPKTRVGEVVEDIKGAIQEAKIPKRQVIEEARPAKEVRGEVSVPPVAKPGAVPGKIDLAAVDKAIEEISREEAKPTEQAAVAPAAGEGGTSPQPGVAPPAAPVETRPQAAEPSGTTEEVTPQSQATESSTVAESATVQPQAKQPWEGTVYRGTSAEVPADEGQYGKGTYYSTSIEEARIYGGDNVEQTTVRLKNPYVVPWKDAGDIDTKRIIKNYGKHDPSEAERISQEIRDRLEAAGHDGIVIQFQNGQSEVVVFNPEKGVSHVQEVQGQEKAPQVTVGPKGQVIAQGEGAAASSQQAPALPESFDLQEQARLLGSEIHDRILTQYSSNPVEVFQGKMPFDVPMADGGRVDVETFAEEIGNVVETVWPTFVNQGEQSGRGHIAEQMLRLELVRGYDLPQQLHDDIQRSMGDLLARGIAKRANLLPGNSSQAPALPEGTVDRIDRIRKEKIAESKAQGNKHLSDVPYGVEAMRFLTVRDVVSGNTGMVSTVDSSDFAHIAWETGPYAGETTVEHKTDFSGLAITGRVDPKEGVKRMVRAMDDEALARAAVKGGSSVVRAAKAEQNRRTRQKSAESAPQTELPVAGKQQKAPALPETTEEGKPLTWDDLTDPDQPVTLYRGEGEGGVMGYSNTDGEWWTTDEQKARKYGSTVRKVTLPAGVVGKFAARGHLGNNVFVFPDRKPPELVNQSAGTAGPVQPETGVAGAIKRGEAFMANLQTDLGAAKAQPKSAFDWASSKVGDVTPYGETILARKVKTKKEAQSIADEQGGKVILDGPKHWAVLSKPASPTQPSAPGEIGPPARAGATGEGVEGKTETPAADAGEVNEVLANRVAERLKAQRTITPDEFWQMADEAYGGTRAEGKYGPSEAYDALELGVNKYLYHAFLTANPRTDFEGAKKTAANIEGLLDRIPTQRNRSGEKDLFQQFSTPPHYAYAVAWVANIQKGDTVLEPSAGAGGLAVFAKNAGARVIVNEISERRAKLLEALGFDRVLREDAEQLHNILDEKPSVVIMNPPFSRAGHRMGNRKIIGTDLKHIDSALKLLQDGGRLVAIMGRPLQEEKGETQTFQRWVTTAKKAYNVRANVYVGRGVYKKYGTDFPTRVLVIDKTGPTTGEIKGGTVDSVDELMYILDGVRNDRQPIQSVQPAVSQGPARPEGITRPESPRKSPTGPVEPGEPGAERPVVEPPERTTGAGESAVRVERPRAVPTAPRDTGAAGQPESERTGVRTGGEPVRQPEEIQTRTERKRDVGEATQREKLGDNIFEQYKTTRLGIHGAKPHPASLVESAPMAAVDPPIAEYKLNIPNEVIQSGQLSDIQLEQIVYAGAAHSKKLPKTGGNEYRRGYMIGDGTGVGKGREIAGVLLDNWGKGRHKAVWVSENQKLFNDATRDWKALGQDPKRLFNLTKVKAESSITAPEGICYVTYGTLRSKAKGKEGKPRIEQIADWFGKDYDGVIVFDESHNMANAIGSKGARGVQGPSQMAKAGVKLQELLPNARVLYVSATAATEVSNFAYAERLGLWGLGTPFATKSQFIAEIDSGGVNAMELVARDMKAMGMYLARGISFNDGTPQGTVEQERLQHRLTPEQRGIYDKLSQAWQVVLSNIEAALESTGAASDSRSRSFALSQFWGTHQRFFNQVITAMQTPTVVQAIEKDIAEGRSAVIQLTNTFEAAQERALADREEDEDLEDFDITPRDMLMQFVEHSFPTAQYETYEDENGNVQSRPVKDASGNPVENKEAVAMRDRLLDELGSIQVPHSPLDMLLNHFGTDVVAEVTGRKRRVVTDTEGRKVIQKRSASENQAEIDRFMSGKKRILIFSEAGGTGASYHADRSQENQQRRVHYLLQAGWRANKAIQGLGRTHRSNQALAPIYRLVHTDLNGQKRFISTIARRLDQLGALTKGERKAGSTGLFTAADNLESTEAQDALRTFFINLSRGNIEGISLADFERQTGLKIRTDQGNVRQQLPDIRQFLNRLLSLNIEMQNRVFDAFQAIHEEKVAQAIVDGTIDQGVENYKADHIHKAEETTVYRHSSGAETKYVKLRVENRVRPTTWDDLKKRNISFYVRNTENGNLYAAEEIHDREDPRSGRIVQQYRLINTTGSHNIDRDHIDYQYGTKRWEKVDTHVAKSEWDQMVAETPKDVAKDEHLITGLILPIWDRLRGKARVYRVLTDEGEMFVGRVVPARQLQQVLKNLGITAAAVRIESGDAIARVLTGDIQIELVNGWRIKRAVVDGETRIELAGPDFQSDDALDNFDVFKERIQFKTRYFIPTGEDAESSYKRITEQWPVADIIEMRGEPGTRPTDPGIGTPSAQGGFIGGRPGAARAQISAITHESMRTGSDRADDFLKRTQGFGWSKPVHVLRKAAGAAYRFARGFHFLPEIPKTKAFAQVRESFRQIMEIPKVAYDTAFERAKWATAPIEGTSVEANKRLQAVRLKLIADDLNEDLEAGVALPAGLEEADVKAMKAEADRLYETYPTVREAYDRIRQVNREYTDMLVSEGWLDRERAKEFYFPHKVLRYLRGNDAWFGIGRRVAKPRRGYLLQRKGGADYSTDVLERLIEHWAEVQRDIETVRFIERVYKKEQAMFRSANPDWKQGDPIPAGYKEQIILPGRFYYRVGGVSEDLVTALLAQDMAAIEDILAAKEAKGQLPVRKVMALGKKRAYIVREEVAKQTQDMPTAPVSDHPLYRAIQNANTFVKRQILFNPLYSIPFHVTNFVGDAHKVLVALPKALASKHMVGYISAIRAAHRGEKPQLFAEAQKRGVIGSGWLGVDVKKIEALIPELERAEISGAAAVASNKAKRLWNAGRALGQSREDWLRYATFAHLVDLQASGVDIAKYTTKDLAVVTGLSGYDKAAKIARDILGDYAAIGKSGVLISDLVAPFYRWMHLNLPWWPRLIKDYAKRGDVGRLIAALLAASAPYLMAMLWNYSDPDRRKIEEKLPPWKRWNFHIIIAGKVYSLPLPVDDVANFIGLPESIADFTAYQKGFIDGPQLVGRIASNLALEPGKAAINSIGGVLGVTRDLFGIQTFPQIADYRIKAWDRRAMNALKTIFGAPAQLADALRQDKPEKVNDILWRGVLPVRPWTQGRDPIDVLSGMTRVEDQRNRPFDPLAWRPHAGKQWEVDRLRSQVDRMSDADLVEAKGRREKRAQEESAKDWDKRLRKMTPAELEKALDSHTYDSVVAPSRSTGYQVHMPGDPIKGSEAIVRYIKAEMARRKKEQQK